MALVVAGGLAVHFFLRRKPFEYKRHALMGLSILLWALSTTFTFQRIADPQFETFTFWQNLPLHFCTLTTFFFFPAFMGRNERWVQPLRALIFYPGLIAAFLAAIAPAQEYLDQPVLSWNTLFYFVHYGNVVLAILMVSLGFFTPTIRNLFGSLLTFFLLAVAVFLIDLVIRATINPTANFFFPFDPEGSFIFEFLWGLIGIPLVYQMPLLIIITPVLLLQYAIYRGIHRLTIGVPQVDEEGLHPALVD